jgi:hypothetical protein
VQDHASEVGRSSQQAIPTGDFSKMYEFQKYTTFDFFLIYTLTATTSGGSFLATNGVGSKGINAASGARRRVLEKVVLQKDPAVNHFGGNPVFFSFL